MDPRVQGRTRHLLIDIFAIAICGVIADCDSWSASEHAADAIAAIDTAK
jgi:hypothetical protein